MFIAIRFSRSIFLHEISKYNRLSFPPLFLPRMSLDIIFTILFYFIMIIILFIPIIVYDKVQLVVRIVSLNCASVFNVIENFVYSCTKSISFTSVINIFRVRQYVRFRLDSFSCTRSISIEVIHNILQFPTL